MFRTLGSFIIHFSLIAISGCFVTSCNHRSSEGMIVLTQIDKDQETTGFSSAEDQAVFLGAKIMMADPTHLDRPAQLLSNDFYSACSPVISFDAKKMIFTGQKSENDVWQIFEMDLANLQYEQLTNSITNCVDPSYLPGEKIVYSKFMPGEKGSKGYALFVTNTDGSQEEQITFSPGFYNGTTVLHDGRIISMNRQASLEPNKTNLMVMRPDGTKEMLFYKTEDGGQLMAEGKESEDGQIYLIEKNKEGIGELLAISYNNPKKSKKLVMEKGAGDFIGINTMNNGRLLVCYRTSKDDAYGLYELDPENMSLVRSVFYDSKYKTIQAAAVEKRKVPKNIPSEVKAEAQTGLLLCQDVNFTGFIKDTVLTKASKAVKIEVLGLESSLGTVDVEKDGSVYLKIKADTPFQLQTLDEQGQIINGPSSWMNLRPNERRACVGCHQGNEVVPLNRQPLSVLKEPVRIPREPKLLAERE